MVDVASQDATDQPLATSSATAAALSMRCATKEMRRVGAVVVVGRNNKAEPSDTLAEIVRQLGAIGFSVYWYESDRSMSSARINRAIETRWPGLSANDPSELPRLRRAMRFVIKSLFALGDSRRWAFVQAAILSEPVMAARELRRFLDDLPSEKVHLVTHSAGGIAATKVADSDKIGRIVCFGYPFKHPDRAPEAYRTNHLATVSKPMLIIQGTADAYGPDSTLFARFLPPATQVLTLDCSHDYRALPAAELARTWTAILQFLDSEREDGPVSMSVERLSG